VLAAGLACWAISLAGDQPRAFRALLVNFIFFAPLATGMVVWSAVVTASRGRWSGPVHSLALAGISFAPVSILALAGLWAGYPHWASWTFPQYQPLGQGAYLAPTAVFVRDLICLVILCLLALLYVRRRTRSRPGGLAGGLIVVYCLVWTLLAQDLVMSLDPRWSSMLFGGYFFVSGMYAAVAAWTLAALLLKPPDADRMHDLGKLIVTFSLLTTYCMFSQLLVIWYENLPREAPFVLARLRRTPDMYYSLALLCVVYLGPLVLLLTRWAKRNRWFLGVVSLAVLAGLWLERWWLVTPTILGPQAPLQLGLAEIGLTAACLAALALGISWAHRRLESRTDFEAVEQS
jgi:hypothetical protein